MQSLLYTKITEGNGMKITEALEYIHSIPKFVRPLGNRDLGKLLEKLNNPQDNLKYIHIAGTNGKGSTAAMIASVLKEAGYKVGLFTSPFIEVFNERIKINGENISDEDLCSLTKIVRDRTDEFGLKISEFAFICALAFLYFSESKVDFVVLETGMGGKLDATNIIKNPLVCAIAKIGLDHTEYLGDTIEEIAAEKCGIIKEGTSVVSQRNETVRGIIEKFSKDNKAELIFCDVSEKTKNGVLYKGIEYELSLKGDYQKDNLALALESVWALKNKGIEISDSAIANGFKEVIWPVRFEFVRDNIVIDGGHNIDGIDALKISLKGKKYGLVIAMMKDKDTKSCVEKISDGAEFVITTEIPMPRCESAKNLAKISGGTAISDFKEAIKKAERMLVDDTILCICGSLYFAAEAKKYLKGQN